MIGNGFDDGFMASYYSTLAILGLIYVVPMIVGFCLVFKNKTLSVSYKIGWTVLFLFLSVMALLAYLVVFSWPKKQVTSNK